MKNKFKFLATMLIGVLLSTNVAWGETIIASWGKVKIETAGNSVAAPYGDANNVNVATFSSNIVLTTNSTYSWANTGINTTPTITIANLNTTGYSNLSVIFVCRASGYASNDIDVYTSMDGSNYSKHSTVDLTLNKEIPFQVNNIPANVTGIQFRYGGNSGSFYFGSVSILGQKSGDDSYACLKVGSNGGTWPASGIKMSSATVNDVTFEALGTGNNGKYYDSDLTWRFYINDGGLQVTAPDETYITKVKVYSLSGSITTPTDWEVSTDGTHVFTPQNGTQVNTVSFMGNPQPQMVEVFYKATGPACTTDLVMPVVTATAGNGSATLTWGAVDHATKYQVSWNGGAYADATSPYVKSGLTNDVTYTWKVKAIGGGIYCDSEEASGNVTPSANHTVAWYVDGEVYTAGSPTTEVADGGTVTELPTPPDVPDACAGSAFVGWTDQEVTDGNKPSTLFKTAANAPTVNADVIYHAVFADPE